jgi:tRNA threonylcarbamoyladenosine biosynthesis protein TsaB
MTTSANESQCSPGRSWLLAIDTSSDLAGVALFDGRRLDEMTWMAGRGHTVSVLDEIDHLVSRVGIDVAGIGAVAAAIGPGSFSALRVGISIAKALVYANGCPLVGVSTLEATAHLHCGSARPIIAAVAAGRERLVWSHFAAGSECCEVVDGPRNGSLEELTGYARTLPGTVLVTGEISSSQEDQLSGLDQIVVTPLSARAGRSGAVAELGWRRWRVGELDDPIRLEPVYVHAGRQKTAVTAR